MHGAASAYSHTHLNLILYIRCQEYESGALSFCVAAAINIMLKSDDACIGCTFAMQHHRRGHYIREREMLILSLNVQQIHNSSRVSYTYNYFRVCCIFSHVINRAFNNNERHQH